MALLLWSHRKYPIQSTRYQSFAQTKGLFDTIAVDDLRPNPPWRLGNPRTDVKRAAHDAAEAAYRGALDDIEKRKNTLLCYLAMVLHSIALILIKHDWKDNEALADGRKAWVSPSTKFRSDETLTVFSVMWQLAHLQLREVEARHNYIIRWQEFPTRIGHA